MDGAAVMRNVIKKAYVLISLAALPLLTGCGASNGSGRAVTDSDFFESKIDGEINISVYDSMLYKNFLKEAARAFENKYPGAKVNIETFSVMPEIKTMEVDGKFISVMQSSDESQTRSDYINRVNTRIMSGEGADIYAMDFLPLNKLINSSALENLDNYMTLDPDFNKNDYRENILEALRFRGGIWLLPINYSFNYFSYDSTLIPLHAALNFGADRAFNTEKLINLGIPFFDGSRLLFNYTGGLGSMFDLLLNENFHSFVDFNTGRANFINGGFASMLESINYFTDHGYIRRNAVSAMDIEELMQRAMEAPAERVFFKLNNSYFLINMFIRELTQEMNTGFSGSIVAAIEDDDKISGIQANADGKVPFSYNLGFGINSSSKNRETAWAFIKFLLSKEMQLSPYIFNLPLNNEARNEKIQFDFKMAIGMYDEELNNRQLQAMENYTSALESLSGLIDTYIIQDTNINDMIMQETQYFLTGTRTAEEVTKALQNKADLYLSE